MMRKNKWGIAALVLALVLAFGGMAACGEEGAAVYHVGDKAEDFTVVLSDGQTVSLYGLLAEKKAVLLNFWASWCGPCQMEFPYLQEAYDQLSNDVGMIALSIHDGDTNEAIEAFKAEHGLSTLPMGRDIGLAAQYGVSAYPTSVIIDRNGVVCLWHEGMIRSTRQLTNTLDMFAGDEYATPVLLDEMPAIPVAEVPGSEALSAALNAEGGGLAFVSVESVEGDETVWPFVPSPDGTYAVAANTDVQGSVANVLTEVEVKAGDVFVYDCQMTGTEYADRLAVFVDSNVAALRTGTFDWTTFALRFEEAGTHQVTIMYNRGDDAGYTAVCALRGIRLLTGDEAAAYAFPPSTMPKTLPGTEVSIDLPTDGMRKVLTVDAAGQPASQDAMMYIVNADNVTLKLRIGAEVNEAFAAVTVVNNLIEQQTTMLSSLEHDDEGYFFPVDPTKSAIGTMITLKANILDAASPATSITICASEDSAKLFMETVMGALMGRMSQQELDQIDYFALSYEGGPVFYTWDDLRAALQAKSEAAGEAAVPTTLSWTITFADSDGKPVPNVMAQICDEATCTVLPSDETGAVRFEGENHAYELHVLMVPAGYQAPGETLPLPEAGGELKITLEAVAE